MDTWPSGSGESAVVGDSKEAQQFRLTTSVGQYSTRKKSATACGDDNHARCEEVRGCHSKTGHGGVKAVGLAGGRPSPSVLKNGAPNAGSEQRRGTQRLMKVI